MTLSSNKAIMSRVRGYQLYNKFRRRKPNCHPDVEKLAAPGHQVPPSRVLV